MSEFRLLLAIEITAQGPCLTKFKKKHKVGNLANYNEYKKFIKKFEAFTKEERIKRDEEFQELRENDQDPYEGENQSRFALIGSAIHECIKNITPDKSYANLLNYLISWQANLIVLQNVYDFESNLRDNEVTVADLITGKIAFANFPDPLKK